jgi:type IV fimbrial biogenesis protein FimT
VTAGDLGKSMNHQPHFVSGTAAAMTDGGPAKHRGFTFGELMVTLALLSIVLMIAVPSFALIIRNSRLITQIYDFNAALNLARSEAIKRGRPVTVCASANQTACGGTTGCNWDQGWIVFVDPNNNHVVDGGEEILRKTSALVNGYTLCGSSGTTLATYLTVDAQGAPSASGQFVLCQNSSINPSRAVLVGTAGRIVMAQDSNGVPLAADGSPITTCTPT